MSEEKSEMQDKGLMLMEEVVELFGKGVKVSVLIRAPEESIVLLSNDDLEVLRDCIDYLTSPPPAATLH